MPGLLTLLESTGGAVTQLIKRVGINQYLQAILGTNPSAYYRMEDLPAVPTGLVARWTPPLQVTPSVVPVPSSGDFTYTLGTQEDAVFIMPPADRLGSVEVTGGRHVKMIGGGFTPDAGSVGPVDSDILAFNDLTGSLALQGVNINAGNFNVNGLSFGGPDANFYPDIYVQNSRITSVKNGSAIKANGPVGRVFIDKFTGSSAKYGVFLPPAFPISGLYLSRVNLVPLTGGSSTPYTLYLLDIDGNNPNGASALVPYPVFMDDVYSDLLSGANPEIQWVYPPAGATADLDPVGLVVSDGIGTWAGSMKVLGEVIEDTPSDYAPSGEVGPNTQEIPYQTVPLNPVVGPVGNYGDLVEHSFDVPGAVGGGHEFGSPTSVEQSIILEPNTGGIPGPAAPVGSPTFSVGGAILNGIGKIPTPINPMGSPEVTGGTPTPVSSGLAISRGPTGSHWGPDCDVPSGKWKRSEWTYGNTMTTGGSTNPVNQWAHAPDAYDAFAAINQKFVYLPDSMIAVAIARMQEIGIRHVRIGLAGPAIDGREEYQRRTGVAAQQVRTANAARNKNTTQAINFLFGTYQCPIDLYNASGQNLIYKWTWTNFVRPLNGPPGSVPYPGSVGNPWGTYYPIGWTDVGALQGQNEAQPSHTKNGGAPDGSQRWMYQQWQIERDSHPTTNVLAGDPYVNFDTGRLTPGPAKAPQLPIFGFGGVGGDTRTFNRQFGDLTTGVNKDIDFGAPHPYQGGAPPWMIRIWGNWGVDAGNEFNNYESYNGAVTTAVGGNVAGPGRFVRTIPWVVGEIGNTTDDRQPVSVRQSQWMPPEINGEYMIRQMIQFYIGGVKRIYWYKLTDEGTNQPMMGHCTDTGVRKACFYAHKNLLGIIGFKERTGTATPLGLRIVSTSSGTGSGNGWVPNPVGSKITGESNFDNSDPDRLEKLEIIKPNDEYLVFLHRSKTLWQRNTKLTVQIAVNDRKLTTWQLPPGDWVVTIAEPSNTLMASPNDGVIYPGQTVAGGPVAVDPATSLCPFTTGIAGVDDLTPDSNNQIKVQLAGIVRVLKVVPAPSGPPAPTIAAPASGSVQTNAAVGFIGTQRNDVGDSGVAVIVYYGSSPSGTIATFFPTAANGAGTGWSATSDRFVNGTYTAQAQQSSVSGQVGKSAPVTFTVNDLNGPTGGPIDDPDWVPYSTS